MLNFIVRLARGAVRNTRSNCCLIRQNRIRTALLCVISLIGCQAQAETKQHALVVGIDNYRFGTDNLIPSRYEIKNLKGAQNDATRIASSLRKRGVELPDENLLINESATIARFKAAWQRVLDQSSPNDVIILTFAGHGGQEPEIAPPIDEGRDNLDETLWFWDFDKKNPYVGRLSDDELFQMFKQASDRQIVFVADSCHSAGLTRSLDRQAGLSRSGGDVGFILELGSDGLGSTQNVKVSEPEEDWLSLRHVTYLTATANEADLVTEVPIDNKPHGALSVSFAEAIEGRADTNDDKVVSRVELARYVDVRVRALAEDKQEPGFLPRGGSSDSTTIFTLDQASITESEPTINVLTVDFDGMPMPRGLVNARVGDNASLVFEYKDGEILAYYGSDEIHRWRSRPESGETARTVQGVIDKYRLLKAIDDSYNVRQTALDLSILCSGMSERGHCNNEHKIAEEISLSFNRGKSEQYQTDNGRFFVLFNLTGLGTLQNQYPIFKSDAALLTSYPFTLHFEVGEPVGRDDFIAIFCKRDPISLKKITKDHDEMYTPDPQLIIEGLKRYDCQVNRLPVFTAN